MATIQIALRAVNVTKTEETATHYALRYRPSLHSYKLAFILLLHQVSIRSALVILTIPPPSRFALMAAAVLA